ncbi:SDR family NAD(P)-dependent oxidoreductase [Brevibacillus laterosporus]|uniref:SDR family NAD(P)-dependent oxidoreductase n=1 Tax=Brevibacillus laterosporus TaxID=1465 RepID=UPI001CA4DEC0|nr:SDR family NAD(P)-dependent oxidoreductase [Brevibacillus laterosporus]MED1663357.1 SDR family NAD(P)-dependent oxidoreductase [Brevibacillus laterosporus]MED1668627.1 SDR family NAD(P)-dependent oxidoreductase [Brevibacillus laterosporus]MED1717416.1 SDR family NAD(P)-dependent oxidoreductase [Brevibacillus laterosporus]
MKSNEWDSLLEKVKSGHLQVDEAMEQVKGKIAQRKKGISSLSLLEERNLSPEIYEYNESFLKDHKVYKEEVIIGVTHASLALNAFFNLFPQENSACLHKLNFIEPIEVKKGQRVEVLVQPFEKGTSVDFHVMYKLESSTAWKMTATGSFRKSQLLNKKIDVEDLKRSSEKYVHMDHIYSINSVVELGDSFRNIRELYKGNDYVLAHVALTQDSIEENHDYVLHPLLINSAFLAMVPLMNQGEDWDGFLPFGIKDLTFSKTEKVEQCWIVIKLVKTSDELIIFNAELVNEESEVIASFTECSVKRLRFRNTAIKQEETNPSSVAYAKDLLGRVQQYFVNKIRSITQGRLNITNFNVNLMELGLDSSQLIELTDEIEKEMSIELNPTLFFEYPSMKELTEFFFREYKDLFHEMAGPPSDHIDQADVPTLPPQGMAMEQLDAVQAEWQTNQQSVQTEVTVSTSKPDSVREDIAIIGMHGVFAEAANLDQFWSHLFSQKDLIKEIPMDHWDYRPWYDENAEAQNKTYCKWGSFINDVDKFDAEFFNISPREAEWMDPQIRLLLQSIYATGEDAGYIKQLRGSNTGVFVGACLHDYADRIAEMNLPVDPYIGTGNAQTVIANRVSFIFDFKGPSMAIDTACSSSLFALHSACQALRNKECDMAFVGGVNLLLSSWHYRYFCSIGALSRTGRCHTFDESADGYVPGEGIASILLKPLSKAKKDKDHIYAVIKGSAALHGGHTPSLTAPSVAGEENVILKAWEDAGVEPESLSYIEAHGTGTKLGDPIEISSVKKAFNHFTSKEQFCAIGSVKANIGHTEGAAGLAGVLKVILQMKHKQIPAMPMFHKLNPYIQLDNSPLYINRENQEWKSPIGIPRRAGVSSFGFSGAYAHVVLEEYLQKTQERDSTVIKDEKPVVIVLSAKNEERLQERVEQLVTAIGELQLSDADLMNIAYTLQIGREHMDERLAVVVSSIAELEQKLKGYVEGKPDTESLYRGLAQSNNQSVSAFVANSEGKDTVNKWLAQGKYAKMAELWVRGEVIEWDELYGKSSPRRISLPTYPFARVRHWIPEMEIKTGVSAHIHPLLHENTSDFKEQRFSSVFTGREFFLADHLVKGQRVLPGVAHLEMARAAVKVAVGELEDERSGICLKDVVWTQPIAVGTEPTTIHIGLFPHDNGDIAYEIYSDSQIAGSEPIVHSQGTALLSYVPESPLLDLKGLLAQCKKSKLSATQCYASFKKMGIEYGASHQGIENIYIGTGQVLAKLSLPSAVTDTKDEYILHPSLMDSALQACIGLVDGMGESTFSAAKPRLPFALSDIEIFCGCKSSMWVFIQYAAGSNIEDKIQKFNIDLCDDHGNVCVRMKALSSRVLEGEIQVRDSSSVSETKSLMEHADDMKMLIPVWDFVSVQKEQTAFAHTDRVVIIGGKQESRVIEQKLPHVHRINIRPDDDVEAIIQKLNEYGQIDHIIWIAPQYEMESVTNETLIEEQENGAVPFFRTMKALLRLDYATRELAWSIITTQAQAIHKNEKVNPAHASLHGLVGTMAKEYANWGVRLFDLEADEDWPIEDMLTMPYDHLGNSWLYRTGQWYRQKLVSYHSPLVEQTRYKQGGVYVVIGGSGGIGEAWSEYMIQTYQAQIIWIGRRQKDEAIQAKLNRLAQLGKAPYYIAADATDLQSLTMAYEEIKQQFSQVNGVIHSAIVLLDQSYAHMDEKRFLAGLAPKVHVSVRLAQVFQKEELDFVLFFSSLSSFTKAPGQSNYASGCTFKDAFAHQLSLEWNCAVKVINWGYWGSVGTVATKDYQDRMEQAGMGSIEPPEAMDALEKLLSGPINQLALLKTTKSLMMDGFHFDEVVSVNSDSSDSNISSIREREDNVHGLLENLQGALARMASSILQVQLEEIDRDAWLNEYGFEPVTLTEFADSLNQEYGLELTSSILFELQALNRIAEYLLEEYGDVVAPYFEKAVSLQPNTSMMIQQMKDMEKMLGRLLWAHFRSLEWIPFEKTIMKDLKDKARIQHKYHRWFEESIAFLVENQYLKQEGESFKAIDTTLVDIWAEWKKWDQQKQEWLMNSDMKAQIIVVEKMMRALSDILLGKVRSTDILFPNSSMELVEGVYKNNSLSDYYNELLADTVVAYVQERIKQDSSVRIRILEIGAGTGGTSAMVFTKMKPYQVYMEQYCYTDLSKSFFFHAERAYAEQNPYVTFQVFDVEKPLTQQGIHVGEYDIVIAANALHATKNIQRTLRNAKAALRKNGLLLLNELTGKSLFSHVTFGLLEGWWLYEDAGLRVPGCPGLSSKTWRKVLEREGFHSVFFPSQKYHSWDQQVIVAESDGIIRQQLPEFEESGSSSDSHKKNSRTMRSAINSAGPKLLLSPNKQRAIPSGSTANHGIDVTDQMVEDHVRIIIRENVAASLKMEEERIQNDRSFSEYGVDSIVAVNLVNLLNKQCNLRLQTTVLFDFNNVDELTKHIILEYRDILLDSLQESVPVLKEPSMQPWDESMPKVVEESQYKAHSSKRRSWRNNRFSTPAVLSASDTGLGQHSTFYRVVMDRPGGIEDIKVIHSEIPAMKANEVRISVRAFSLNFGDLLCLRGLYPTMPPYPFTPGFEASGVVIDVGEAVTSVQQGDEVIVALGASFGGQASLITCLEEQVFFKPSTLSFEEACTLPASAMTMINAFRKAQLKQGDKILIQTATGGTGLIAVQLAKHYGAEIYATAGSKHKLDYLEKLGVPYRINYVETDFEQEIKRLTNGKGIDVIINTLPGDAIQKGLNCLSPNGRYIELAMTALKSAKTIDLSVLGSNQTFYSVNSRKLANENPEQVREYFHEMLSLVELGIVQPTIFKVIPFDKIKEAYRYLDDRKNIGKIVVSITDEYQCREKGLVDKSFIATSGFTMMASHQDQIAIIGMSGRFAQSNSVNELWEHLAKGTDLIEEITRWNLSEYPASKENDFCKYGSYLDDIDKFDPLFFNISGLEATYMDPQQRLFLEEAWRALEDAGYAGADMGNRKFGVYVGSSGGDYTQLFDDKAPAQAFWGNAGSVIPARIAYYLNLQGPAVTVDTACSSSLVAIHLACQSLRAKETEMALAGGVFIQTTPKFHMSANKAGMLSPTGRCHTFDEQADGFVPGEGVGAIVLKRLQDAIADGDHIYGVIRGSGLNQDGTTNGITAPSAMSQERLIREVYDNYHIDPEQIQMVEAHGTGTKLGDPIEYQALTRAFRSYTDQKEYCSIGSIKSNIGHAAAAAGIAGVIKILLSLQHKKIPPSLHFNNGNSNIQFEDSPFYVNTELRAWDVEGETKRCAVVSSFGFSGTNAHIAIEEAPQIERKHAAKPGYLIVLSACAYDQIKQQAEQLVGYCERQDQLDCGNLSYTLMQGRKHFHHRLALVARSQDELIRLLKKWLEKGKASQVYYSEINGNDSRVQQSLKRFGNQCIAECQNTMQAAEYLEHLASIAELYVQGYPLSYEQLFEKQKYARIPLPTYPFARERYWILDRDVQTQQKRNSDVKQGSHTDVGLITRASVIHPLLHQNTSDFTEQRFSSTFTGEEFFLADHVVNEQKVLPGVAYLEMARVAIELATGRKDYGLDKIRLQNVVWARPIIVSRQPINVHIRLYPEDNGEVVYEIYSNSEASNEEVVMHSQGRGSFSVHDNAAQILDLEELQAMCIGRELSSVECYEAFKDMGINYGLRHQGIDKVYTGDGKILAKLSLPASIADTKKEYVLHPSMMDSALQAAIALLIGNDDFQPSLPFALQELEIFDRCSADMWALLQYSSDGHPQANVKRLDIDLCDPHGKVCVRMKGFSSRVLESDNKNGRVLQTDSNEPSKKSWVETNLFTPVWDRVQINEQVVFPASNHRIVIVGDEDEGLQAVKLHYPTAQTLKLHSQDSITEVEEKLRACGTIDHIVWIAPKHSLEALASNGLIEQQNKGVLQFFRWVKASLYLGYGIKKLGWSIITEQTQPIHSKDSINPAHASLHGLIGSMAKEYPNWSVRLIDLEKDRDWPIPEMFSLPADKQGNAWVYREPAWYRQQLVSVSSFEADHSIYKYGGVYVVIGGSGGIGEVWSEYMIRTYQAQVVWIGRRQKDGDIQKKINRLGELGPKPVYITADAKNRDALKQAYDEIKAKYMQINGVVHSAIVLLDKGLANMDEERFREGLSAKVDVSVRMAQVFGEEPLDFVLFFSSINSFTKPAGQSNYVSGCTFKDAFAHQLSLEWSCAIRVMNWGYWGSVGIVASKAYQDKMVQAGIGSIEPHEGMESLEALLAGPVQQMMMIKSTKPSLLEGMVLEEQINVFPARMKSSVQNVQNRVPAQQDARIQYVQSEMSQPMQKMEELLGRLLWGQFHSMGWIGNENCTAGKLPSDLHHSYHRWFEESIEVLKRYSYLQCSSDTNMIISTSEVDIEAEWKEWDRKKEEWLINNNMKNQVVLAEKALRALPKIVTGKVLATDILFPNSSMELVEGIYKHNLVADYFNEMLADTIVAYVQEKVGRDIDSKIRILEIGAGTGGTSAIVFAKLKPYQEHIQEYCYTDLSKAFLLHAEKTYGSQNPYLTYQILDVEKPLEKQGISVGEYDLVIATNVLHATQKIRRTLRNAKAALQKNGLILINEISTASLFTHLTFGLLEGWWLYEDTEVRIPGCPGLFPKTWKEMLEVEGFRSGFFPAWKGHMLGAAIIVAESDGMIRQPHSSSGTMIVQRCVETSGQLIVERSQPANVSQDLQDSSIQDNRPARPKTSTGQIGLDVGDQMVKIKVRSMIRENIAEALQMEEERIQNDRSFSEYGVDSIIAVNLVNLINQSCNIALQTTILFDYNNVNQLTEYIIREHKAQVVATLQENVTDQGLGSEAVDNGTQERTSVEILEDKRSPYSRQQRTRNRFKGQEATFTTDLAVGVEGSTASSTYHRVVIERPGGIDDLKMVQSAIPNIKANQVQIAVRAFSLNFGDLLCVRGLYPSMPPYPFTPGFEASGVVVDVGEGVTSVQRGDQVIVAMGEDIGGQASLITCSAEHVYSKPEMLTFEEACSLPAVAITMIDAFHKARIKRGERILIQTATGGTGLIAVQLAKYFGAEIYATAGSSHKLDYLEKLGVPYRINYLETDFEQEINRLTDGQGVHVVINTLAGDAIQKGMNCLASGGRYIELAMTALKSARTIDLSVLSKNQSFYSVDIRRLALEEPETLRDYWNQMISYVEQGIIRPTISQIIPFHQFKEAYRYMENRKNIGKIVVSLPEAFQHIKPASSENPLVKINDLGNSAFSQDAIAIIGMSGRFAKSNFVHELWKHLAEGTDLIEEVTRWNLSEHDADGTPEGMDYCNHGSFMDEIDQFDPLFFNISGLEATYMDPQQRIFLEESWKALEDAGYAGAGNHTSQCGVYVGSCGGDYARLFGNSAPPQAFWGNAGSVIPARIAYYLNLQGPAVTVDTACSSSLVAIHLACQSLWTKETNMALAGGVFVQSTPEFYSVCNRAGMLSPTGRCYTFDDRADGFVPGEGAGVVVLKRLQDALADGDHIYGVIRGSGINQDGTTNGITAPSAKSQERLECHVYDTFHINPEQIQMIEAHGTGTKLGDPIEFQSLTRAFKNYTDKKEYCAIGSIKTNLGHPAAAAGIAGFIKVLLSLTHKKIPPSLHFESGNSNISFEESPFYVNTALKEWTVDTGVKRCAAVSSFGFSGTNAHIVIEEAPQKERKHVEKPAYMIVLSARTTDQLRQQVEQLVHYCELEPSADCKNMSFTLMMGRKHHNHRISCVVRNQAELIGLLKTWLKKGKALQVYQAELHGNEENIQQALLRYGNQCIENCRNNSQDRDYLEYLSVIAELYVQGYPLEFEQLFIGDGYGRIPLPTYPFAREHYWIEGTRSQKERAAASLGQYEFDDSLWNELFDQVINDSINVDTAVLKAKKFLIT